MLFTQTLITLVLTSVSVSVSAFPVTENDSNSIVARDATYTCTPKKNDSSVKKFKVSESRALAQAKIALYEAGKSGDPHRYHNGDNIQFGTKPCNKKDAELWEYPIYWDDLKKEWKKDEASKDQAKTPLRIVYLKDKGSHDGRPKLCGVMTHSEVDANNQGKDFFVKCDK
ncbi:unnamed protein product [Periconia digitata]|uniref:Uncharacterized protein n=1 Tax=Periconia digitata TaxID=1303443 RepID=A0A9W4XM00_9PLEO|nr:unnamed protein product [Periconia digitata]